MKGGSESGKKSAIYRILEVRRVQCCCVPDGTPNSKLSLGVVLPPSFFFVANSVSATSIDCRLYSATTSYSSLLKSFA
jgi:hypothetical protein